MDKKLYKLILKNLYLKIMNIYSFSKIDYIDNMCFNFHSLYSNSFEASYRIYEYLIKKKNNILFDDGNLAANHINSIWDNPLDWWNSDKLLNVRKKFMNQFAMTSSKPINKWEKKLEKIYIKF